MAIDNVPPFVEPEGHSVHHWYKEDYKKWLAVRGQATDCDKDCFRERVMSFQRLPVEQQPPFLPMECGSADGMMKMLRSMAVMLATLRMQPAVEGEKHAEMISLHVRIFLNTVVKFEGHLKRKGSGTEL
jgi:hypothetical protein